MERSARRLARLARFGSRLSMLAGLAGCLYALGGGAALAVPPKPAPPAASECVQVQSEASFASVGYDHLVHLTSRCKKPAACSVKTDVNPDTTSVLLAPGERRTLITWRGSPAREFKPEVTCVEK